MIDQHLQNAARKRKCAVDSCDQQSSWGQNTCRQHDWTRVHRRKTANTNPQPDDEWIAVAERVKVARSIAGRRCDVCGGEARAVLGTRKLCTTCHSVRAGRQ